MTDRHHRDPDPAALHELRSAFGVEPDDDAGADEAAETRPVEGSDELFIVQQTPHDDELDPETPPEAATPLDPETPPTIIRIDDLSGSVQVRTAQPGVDTTAEPAPPRPRDPDEPVPESVVVIADDTELPDPVYVEGSLDRSSGRSIVFIEDDATGDTMSPDAGREGRRGIEPRMRERRVAVKRAQSRKRLKWVALVTGVVVVGAGGLALLGSPLFAIKADQVTITGNVYTDPDRLAAIVDDLVGTPELRVDHQRIEEELEAISWVDSARVRTDFPHSATIEIRERAAMTTYQGPDGRFRVLDREGRVLDVIDKYPFAYVLIAGPDPVDLDQGEFAPSGYAGASELAKNLTGSVRGRVEYIVVTADGSRLELVLDDGSTVFFGEARDLFAKLLRLETVLTANPEREPGPIDVSTDDVTL